MLSFQVDINKTHQTKFGAFPHKDLIGKTFGTKVCILIYLLYLELNIINNFYKISFQTCVFVYISLYFERTLKLINKVF